MIIPYNASKEERDRITAEREKKLYQSFENMRKQIDDQIQTMNFSTVSEKVKRQQLEEIRNELQKQLQSHYNALESGLKNDMVNIGQSVLNESESFYKGLNMPIGMSITSFPVEIMNNVVNGSVYQEKWYLSRALWGDYTEKLDQINEVISNGVGLNLPSFEIAKQLEQYVDPSAMTPSKTIVTHCLQDPVTGKLYSMDYVKRHPEKDWTGFKEKDSRFRYGKVDYNAQRLARTLINHAYQQNVVHQAQANPFATGVRWDASGGERMCEICEERDGKIFPADDVPLDHPNGMCTFEVVTDLNMMEMSNVLADFVNGEPTEYDDKLYAWYNDRAEVPIERAPDMFAQHVIAEGGDISETWQRRPDQFDFEIEDVMAAQGFDGLPRVVSKEEFEAAVKAANGGEGFIAQRTYSASDQETLDMYRDMLYNGKWYVDCGTGGHQYGQGMYCAADYNGVLSDGIQEEMQHYQDLNVSRLSKSFSSMSQEDQIRVLPDIIDELVPGLSADKKQDLIDYFTYDRIDESRSLVSFERAKETRASLSNSGVNIGKFGYELENYRFYPKAYTETLTLDPSAKIISYSDLEREFLDARNGAKQRAEEVKVVQKVMPDLYEKFMNAHNIPNNERAYFKYGGILTNTVDAQTALAQYSAMSNERKSEIDRLKLEFMLNSSNELNTYLNEVRANFTSKPVEINDIGSFAVARGYDAINAESHGKSGSYTVVLNRTKLIIKEPDE